ncbi:IDE [Lepeophtheirus salmonis]|uniref:Insulin-degrading enzyme n=1 Tax=Lepeophtheirus salmonis TaxID=72036 RepID=A0A7R8D0S9_LEPSM|nr:IDE [Lepeophtheirus salmonis]CAF2944109.1 IDE [Lepeophtheirus salmonis]
MSIIKSSEDNREYRGLTLENGLKVMLISDAKTEKSAAAMDVFVGHMSDPEELLGLAHFLEHMLFLGTEKYPDESEYSHFISKHSGSNNAYTSHDHTTYIFDIGSDYLKEALDRFCQFFISPLFTESATDREVKAVHSEHEKNIASDLWRILQLEKSLSNPEHDFSKFGTGNIYTLDENPKSKGISVRDQLIKFHKKWYSSDIMSLAVLGSESLDELEKIVVDKFSAVPKKGIKPPFWSEHPIEESSYIYRTFVVPIKDLRNLLITFPTPDLHPYYKSSPSNYIAHLIGHEGKGSLLSELRARGWANGLESGGKFETRGFSFFCVSVDLTEIGINHTDEIMSLIFQYIELIRREGLQKWIFDQCKEIKATHFKYLDKSKPYNFNFDLVKREPGQGKFPSIIKDTPLMRLWFKQDDEFLLPKANLKFEFKIPLVNADPHHVNLSRLFLSLLRDDLNEYIYSAILAGLNYAIHNTKQGIMLGVYGYNEMQPMLLDKVMYKLTNFKTDEKRFCILKEQYVRSLKNFKMDQPHEHSIYNNNIILSEKDWHKDELLDVIDELTIESMNEFVGNLFSKTYIEGLVHGNLTKSNALDIFNIIEQTLSKSKPLTLSQLVKLSDRELVLEDNSHVIYEVTNEYHKCSKLRNSWGYLVYSGLRRNTVVQGFRFVIRSDRHPRFVDSRIEAFLQYMINFIREMSIDEFNDHKQALQVKRLEKPKRLSSMTDRYWGEILRQTYIFDRDVIETNELLSVTKEELMIFFEKFLSNESKIRRKLACHVISMTSDGVGKKDQVDMTSEYVKDAPPPKQIVTPIIIKDTLIFKSSRPLYPQKKISYDP